MIRTFAIGLISLSLTACGVFSKPRPAVEFKRPPADVPDAALVVPCDTSNNPTPTNGAMADELVRVRGQRDDCAVRMDGVRQHRTDELRRASEDDKPKG
jgi:mRNA-degrading endonuclease toxin of MazEF toxin-antitoxin module